MNKETLINNIVTDFENMSNNLFGELLWHLPDIWYHKLVTDMVDDVLENVSSDIWALKGVSLVDKYSQVAHNYANIFFDKSDGLVWRLTIVNWLYQILHLMERRIKNM